MLCMAQQSEAQAIGRIGGVVKDPSGAVVVGAKITATQQGTAFTRSTASTNSGDYTLSSLPVGTYDLRTEASGFATGTINNVTLDVNQQRQVNFELVVAGTAQTVEATASPSLLDTETSTLGGFDYGKAGQYSSPKRTRHNRS